MIILLSTFFFSPPLSILFVSFVVFFFLLLLLLSPFSLQSIKLVNRALGWRLKSIFFVFSFDAYCLLVGNFRVGACFFKKQTDNGFMCCVLVCAWNYIDEGNSLSTNQFVVSIGLCFLYAWWWRHLFCFFFWNLIDWKY